MLRKKILIFDTLEWIPLNIIFHNFFINKKTKELSTLSNWKLRSRELVIDPHWIRPIKPLNQTKQTAKTL